MAKKRRFEEQQGEVQQSVGLDFEQANTIRQLLDQLAGQIAANLPIKETVDQLKQIIQQQQEAMDRYWQELEQQRHHGPTIAG